MKRCATLGLALLLAGCVEVEGFDPVGLEAAIVARWTIDGSPPTSASCGTLGANRVRITFVDDRRPVTHSALFAACTLGTLDSREGAGAVVGAGTWTVRLDAIDGAGALVAAGPAGTVTVPPGAAGDAGVFTIEVPDADFGTATLSTTYLIGGERASTGRCEAAGISTVGWLFEDLDGGAVSGDEPEPCALGVIGVRLAPGHLYRFRVRAFDAAGGVVAQTDTLEHTPTVGCDQRLDEHNAAECNGALVGSTPQF